MNKGENNKEQSRDRRRARIRSRIKGTAARPRLSVFRSNRHLYAQLIDDERGITILSANSRDRQEAAARRADKKKTGKETPASATPYFQVGQKLAAQAKSKKISRVVFDRGGYKYHGQIKELAEGARQGGLEF